MSESIMKYQSSTDDLQKKIFLLENDIKKKDAVICYLNIKLNKLYVTLHLGTDDPKNHIKEIYLLEPSASLMLLHDELEEVKGKNEEMTKKLENAVDMQLRVVYKENQNVNERNVILFNEVCEQKKTISQMKNEIKKFQFDLNESDKMKFEASLNLEKENLFKNYEKYLDEFNAKTQRLSEIIVQDEIKDCYKSFITNVFFYKSA